jgi:hypothetical protein
MCTPAPLTLCAAHTLRLVPQHGCQHHRLYAIMPLRSLRSSRPLRRTPHLLVDASPRLFVGLRASSRVWKRLTTPLSSSAASPSRRADGKRRALPTPALRPASPITFDTAPTRVLALPISTATRPPDCHTSTRVLALPISTATRPPDCDTVSTTVSVPQQRLTAAAAASLQHHFLAAAASSQHRSWPTGPSSCTALPRLKAAPFGFPGFFHHHEPSPRRHTGPKAAASLLASLSTFFSFHRHEPSPRRHTGPKAAASLLASLSFSLSFSSVARQRTAPGRLGFHRDVCSTQTLPVPRGSRCTRSQLQTGFPQSYPLSGQCTNCAQTPVSHLSYPRTAVIFRRHNRELWFSVACI